MGVTRNIAKLFDKDPPQAPEAEAALLGSMILDSKVIGDVLHVIKSPQDFAQMKHVTIYSALVDIDDTGEDVDLVKLRQYLADKHTLENVGGVNYLIELAESRPSASSALYYAKIVRDKSKLRSLIDLAGDTLYRAYDDPTNPDSHLEKVENELFKLADGISNKKAVDLNSVLNEVYDELADKENKLGIPSPWGAFNAQMPGFKPGHLVIVAGRPSMGKTAWAMNVAQHAAIRENKPVVFFSMEMDSSELGQRILCSETAVELGNITNKSLSGSQYDALSDGIGKWGGSPFYIDDTPGLSILQLRSKARQFKHKHNIQMVVVDYLQLMNLSEGDNREQAVSHASRSLKLLARELEVPVLCVSQLNRGAENRESKRPRMSDLRESGAIEQDADEIILLHRPDYFNVQAKGDKHEPDHEAEIIIAKQRNGPTGTVKLKFNGPMVKFEETGWLK